MRNLIVLTIIILFQENLCNGGLAFRKDINNSELNLYEECVLLDSTAGICDYIEKCVSVKKLIEAKQYQNISLCYFDEKPVYCCKKSKKFENALCKDAQTKVEHNDIDTDLKVMNGFNAEVGEFPHQVALGYESPNELNDTVDFNCGGTLIAEDVVLTASHCVNRRDSVLKMVRIGRTSLNLSDINDDSIHEDIEVKKIIKHRGYSLCTKHNDIALVKLTRPVNKSKTIDFACLPTKDMNPPSILTISGFGRYNDTHKKKSDWLKKGELEIYPHEKCQSDYSIFNTQIVASQMCANSEQGVDSCQGDSGGPIQYIKNGYYYVYGIVSFGKHCGSNFPGVYTKVDAFLDWIEEKMIDFDDMDREQ